ncbi:MAG: response regulator [Deltaproteobacteria bacterium]|nr:response regulator [Deltaproteobacteria bacterium]
MAKILVVDDDRSLRKMLCLTLRKDGFEAIEAADGNQAIKLVESESVDLVLTDIVMPDKEGIQLIIELKRTNPEIKIIAMSGGGLALSELYLTMAKQVGADQIIAKPIFRDDLINMIRQLLGD